MTYRVIQWGTGAVGKQALQSILRRPDLQLVGVAVHDEQKVGVDAGTLAGLAPVGITAVRELADVLSCEADCVCYMPLPSAQVGDDPDLDEKVIRALLASGKNVVTAVGFVYPKARGPELVARLEEACRAGGSSLHGTGVNPGFMNEVMPLTLSGLCTRVDEIRVRDSSDFSTYPSHAMVVDMMGFTKRPEQFEHESGRWFTFVDGLFVESVHMLADGLGVALDRIDRAKEVATAKETFGIAAAKVERGAVSAQRWEWTGIVDGRPYIQLEAIYKTRPGEAPQWSEAGFSIHIAGQPRIDLDLDERWCSSGIRATAGHAVNAIPLVCAAQPGIRTALDLPLITAHGVRREEALLPTFEPGTRLAETTARSLGDIA